MVCGGLAAAAFLFPLVPSSYFLAPVLTPNG